MQELVKSYARPISKGGIIKNIDRPYNSDYVGIKILVEIYEDSFMNNPYLLEFYAHGEERVELVDSFEVGDMVIAKYYTKSKYNDKTGFYYTTNTLIDLRIANEKQITKL